jgi:hypothetical protein
VNTQKMDKQNVSKISSLLLNSSENLN